MYIVKVRKSYGDTYAVYTCSESIYNLFGQVADIPLYLCSMNIWVGKHCEDMLDV